MGLTGGGLALVKGLGDRGGPREPIDGRMAVGGGRSHPGHVQGRMSSSAARSLAYIGRSSSIGWLGEVNQMTWKLCGQGIWQWHNGLPESRALAGGGIPARMIWRFW
jgi:hypothetical protein